jgi:hypothetical protein
VGWLVLLCAPEKYILFAGSTLDELENSKMPGPPALAALSPLVSQLAAADGTTRAGRYKWAIFSSVLFDFMPAVALLGIIGPQPLPPALVVVYSLLSPIAIGGLCLGMLMVVRHLCLAADGWASQN